MKLAHVLCQMQQIASLKIGLFLEEKAKWAKVNGNTLFGIPGPWSRSLKTDFSRGEL